MGAGVTSGEEGCHRFAADRIACGKAWRCSLLPPCISRAGFIAGFRQHSDLFVDTELCFLSKVFLHVGIRSSPVAPRRVAPDSARLGPSIFQLLAASCHHWVG